jgi:small redox-active disulfide protein 2
MKIEIIGPGCPRCLKTEEIVQKAVKELGIQAEVVKVSDMIEIMKKKVLRTPAVIIDGKIVIQGKIPSIDEIKNVLQQK